MSGSFAPIHFDSFRRHCETGALAPWQETLSHLLEQRLAGLNHGDLPQWLQALERLPRGRGEAFQWRDEVLSLGQPADLQRGEAEALETGLRALMPWRKGPYRLFGLTLDTEWRSDFKWDRLSPHISDLRNRLVLDVGCGNGYHCWRMLAAGARQVVGVDPSIKFLVQFEALRRLGRQDLPVDLLPLGVEDLPRPMGVFDSVFSMGVFYHRRSPLDHLLELRDLLRPGGELILETLVVEGDERTLLLPENRYAGMRNVFFLPSVAALRIWLERMGFEAVRCLDVNQTSTREQRATDWMRFHSLPDFLDPEDSNRTREGYPAPRRALFIARRPCS